MRAVFLLLAIVVLPMHLLSMPKDFLWLGSKGRVLYPALAFAALLLPPIMDTDLAYIVGCGVSLVLLPWLFAEQDIGSPRLALARMIKGEGPKQPHELSDEVLVRTANSRYFSTFDYDSAEKILIELEKRDITNLVPDYERRKRANRKLKLDGLAYNLSWLASDADEQLRLTEGIENPGDDLLDNLEYVVAHLSGDEFRDVIRDEDVSKILETLKLLSEVPLEQDWLHSREALKVSDVYEKLRIASDRIMVDLEIERQKLSPIKVVK